MIQIITDDYQKQKVYKNISNCVVSSFGSPKSFAQFDVNIIDLSFSDLWLYKGYDMSNIDKINDLKHYKKMIETAGNSKVIVLFPQNIIYHYYYDYNGYHKTEKLKNLLMLVEKIVKENIHVYHFKLNFEETVTIVDTKKIEASFYFDETNCKIETAVTRSDKSDKVTSIKVENNLYYTTINLIDSPEELICFLSKNKLMKLDDTEIPDWFEKINFFDDAEIKENIQKIEIQIEELEKSKSKELERIQANNEIKSILYETDKGLQNKVIKILKEMLECEKDDFVDEMEEDFRVKKEEVTFIVETKGLSKNVKGTDVNKAFDHVLIYEEKLQEEEKQENVKGIFIVAIQREKNPIEREELADRQVIIAKRNNILIVRVEELLKLFEAYRKNEIATNEIIEQFKNKNGEYKYNKLCNKI
ncbi:MAG: hypothetical protein J6C46_09120 [Clostridia bacterium]|nr:hypothetical protein [Clostridia bacterium]